MTELCGLKIHVNGQQTFLINQKVVSRFSGRLNRLIAGAEKGTDAGDSGIHIDGFPGGPDGFELMARFCYGGGAIRITPANVCLLRCCALFLDMTEEAAHRNLLHRTTAFLGGMADWPWADAVSCLRACDSLFPLTGARLLAQQLVHSLLLPKIFPVSSSSSPSSSSPSSSPEAGSDRSRPSFSTPDSATKPRRRPRWFDEFTSLPPAVIRLLLDALAADCDGTPLLTRFLLHYLSSAAGSGARPASAFCSSEYGALAETAVRGVIAARKKHGGFTCRGLFWVLRVASCFGLSGDCRGRLEEMIGGALDEATVDDLLVRDGGAGAYDVGLVRRLIRVYVRGEGEWVVERMKKVGRLVDEYLREIAPDQGLEVSKFLRIADSLPDCARICFDGVYRAIDIYLQAHPRLPWEERSRLCGCLNYDKLTLPTCKELAKNPAIPPAAAVRALMAQSPPPPPSPTKDAVPVVACPAADPSAVDARGMRVKLASMHSRAVELEKTCRDMKGQILSRLTGSCHYSHDQSMGPDRRIDSRNCSPSDQHHHHHGTPTSTVPGPC